MFAFLPLFLGPMYLWFCRCCTGGAVRPLFPCTPALKSPELWCDPLLFLLSSPPSNCNLRRDGFSPVDSRLLFSISSPLDFEMRASSSLPLNGHRKTPSTPFLRLPGSKDFCRILTLLASHPFTLSESYQHHAPQPSSCCSVVASASFPPSRTQFLGDEIPLSL